MSKNRTHGLMLIGIGIILFLGSSTEALPPETFWAGLLTYPIGGFLFFKGSREAIQRSEQRMVKIRNPQLKNETVEKHAKHLATAIEEQGTVDELARRARMETQPSMQRALVDRPDELVLEELPDGAGDPEAGSNITSDVSFPLEVQQHDSLAEQLEKLFKLHQDGIISAEELAIAKAKVLG